MRYIQALLVTVAFLLCAGQANGDAPNGWTCRNDDMEISCIDGSCKTSEEHTPMSISLSDAEIAVCAYSGCWTGLTSDVRKTGRFETYIGTQLPWSHDPIDTATVAVTVDAKTGIATIIVGEMYAQPATCTRLLPAGP